MIAANVKAGMMFRCCCCGESFPEDQAIVDQQLGPVCKECNTRLLGANAWLKEIFSRPLVMGERFDAPIEQVPGVPRPVNTSDLVDVPDKIKRRLVS